MVHFKLMLNQSTTLEYKIWEEKILKEAIELYLILQTCLFISHFYTSLYSFIHLMCLGSQLIYIYTYQQVIIPSRHHSITCEMLDDVSFVFEVVQSSR